MRIAILLFMFVAIVPTTAHGQQLAKIRSDYFTDSTQQYRPNDPWTRSRIWLRQSGHSGLFYNCDCEEEKRFSPYICWKNGECPGIGESWRKFIWRDKHNIAQRIADGSCKYDCGTCKQNKSPCQCPLCLSGRVANESANDSTDRVARKQSSLSSTLLERVSAANEAPPPPDQDR